VVAAEVIATVVAAVFGVLVAAVVTAVTAEVVKEATLSTEVLFEPGNIEQLQRRSTKQVITTVKTITFFAFKVSPSLTYDQSFLLI